MPVLRVGETCLQCEATGVRPPRRVAAQDAPLEDPRRYTCVQHLLLGRLGGTQLPAASRDVGA